mgnify:CR=1 FL=1
MLLKGDIDDDSKITKKDINKLFWRSMCVNASFNYERHMSQGIQYALSPALTKLYDDKKRFIKSTKSDTQNFLIQRLHYAHLF